MTAISRTILVHPHRRRLLSSAQAQTIYSRVQSNQAQLSTRNGDRQRNAPAITKTSAATAIETANFAPSGKDCSDQALDDTPPSSKFKAPSKTRYRQHNRAIFPWRHSPHPLPRLVPDTIEEYEDGGIFGPRFPISGGTLNAAERGIFFFGSLYLLGLTRPWRYRTWKTELEDGFLSAFALGLQGVLIDVYRAPTSYEHDDEPLDYTDDDISEDNDEDDNAYIVYIDHTIDNSSDDDPLSNDNTDTNIKRQESTDTIQPPLSQYNNDTNDNDPPDLEDKPNLHDMLETNLQSIYRSAHLATKSKLNIHLECQPKSAHLISLFTIPLITREEVTQTPSLQDLYPDLYRKLLSKTMEEIDRSDGRSNGLSWRQVYAEMKEFVEDKVEKQDDVGVIPMTVVAQAVIECDEVFYVRDVESGAIVQGDDDGKVKEVPHLVRFEMVVNWDWQQGKLLTNSWQITDWDDLLDGNIWYL